MSPEPLHVGYIPLTDCAPLVVARELGFDRDEGLALRLTPAPSWATLRDRLATGAEDAAHMLAPVPIAQALGLGPLPQGFEALQVLSVNGTIVGLSRALAERLSDTDGPLPFADPVALRARLLAATPLRVAVPFGYSMHRELLHRWLGDDAPLQIRTVPPPQMAEALRSGTVDLFCVGEPWGSVAVDSGLAHLILPGSAIWSFAPEKVLATRTGWAEANPELARALMRAVWRAGRWLADPGARATAVEMLARPALLGQPAELLDRAMQGRLVVAPDGTTRDVPGFVHFHDGAAAFPWRSQAAWIADRLARRLGHDRADARARGRQVFRSDLFRAHLSGLGADMPSAASKVEGALTQPTALASAEGRVILPADRFFDGKAFDPGD
ncbi:CmpA/NrtA family ABC transporter substrate-binding protein [Jannaschia marina]|uniref:CmpA/NrtA family ABC transporter substrate-binding protein n=1 Tax=Jannaschia marina TaxID=2741674 RepID=UPI0015CB6225|nr:CmpA/NrtA family ABC transporter substrate-binding protein [Jannaschia marina]